MLEQAAQKLRISPEGDEYEKRRQGLAEPKLHGQMEWRLELPAGAKALANADDLLQR